VCKVGLGVLAAALVVGCVAKTSVPPSLPMTAEQVVAKRAQARLDLIRAGKLAEAYEYLPPATRATLPVQVFVSRLASVSWLSAKVKSARCESEVCDVVVELEFYVLPGRAHKQDYEDKWVLTDRQWWIVYKP
jgi:hypothetical protein